MKPKNLSSIHARYAPLALSLCFDKLSMIGGDLWPLILSLSKDAALRSGRTDWGA